MHLGVFVAPRVFLSGALPPASNTLSALLVFSVTSAISQSGVFDVVLC